MELYIIIFGLLISALLGFLVYKISIQKTTSNASTEEKETQNRLLQEIGQTKAQHEQAIQAVAKQQQEIISIKKERDILAGSETHLQTEKERQKAQIEALNEKIEEYRKGIAKFRAEEASKDKEYQKRIADLDNSRQALVDEKLRIQKEDEVLQTKIFEEKNRKWNDHENEVLYTLKDLCKKPEIHFPFFDNTNLPINFDGRLKPDFMIEFLGQYIIFDAKKSMKSEGIKTYITDQVKKYAEKYKEYSSIYSQVFFVIPEEGLKNMNKLSFSENGFNFFIISKEAIEPILFNFKRITEYENIEQLDPQERENIVDLISHYDRHILFQNAANILLAKESIGLKDFKEKLSQDLQTEIKIKSEKIREKKLPPTEIKKVTASLKAQELEIETLTNPKKPTIPKDQAKEIQNLFLE